MKLKYIVRIIFQTFQNSNGDIEVRWNETKDKVQLKSVSIGKQLLSCSFTKFSFNDGGNEVLIKFCLKKLRKNRNVSCIHRIADIFVTGLLLLLKKNIIS